MRRIFQSTRFAFRSALAPGGAGWLLLAALVVLAAVPTATAQTPPAKDEKQEQQDAGADTQADTAASEQGEDIDALRKEYLKLRDELFRSRARAATVAGTMYSTRLSIELTYGSGRRYAVTRATLRLDGANVFDDMNGVIASDQAPRFSGFVAPGRHAISVRIETTGKDDERFTSALENTFTIQAPAGEDVLVVIKAKDAGDIAYAWDRKHRGSYRPSLSIAVSTQKRPQTGEKTGEKKSAAVGPRPQAAKTTAAKKTAAARPQARAQGGGRGR